MPGPAFFVILDTSQKPSGLAPIPSPSHREAPKRPFASPTSHHPTAACQSRVAAYSIAGMVVGSLVTLLTTDAEASTPPPSTTSTRAEPAAMSV
jgi:hypothetical protein